MDQAWRLTVRWAGGAGRPVLPRDGRVAVALGGGAAVGLLLVRVTRAHALPAGRGLHIELAPFPGPPSLVPTLLVTSAPLAPLGPHTQAFAMVDWIRFLFSNQLANLDVAGGHFGR